MARIHTHYDNLKVSRKAPQEVIRAAYKALSQKYHPDKNLHDEKAARIMAILNSAYGTLADPVRRREHDEWIAAEEWEIEWLESTRAEESAEQRRQDQWEPEPVGDDPVYRPTRDPRWWLAAGLFLLLGCAGGIVLMSQTSLAPTLFSMLGMRGKPASVPAPARPIAAPVVTPVADSWAVSKASLPDGPLAPDVKVLAVTALVIPKRAPDCDTELHALVAPNGEPWPQASGYLSEFPLANPGAEMEIALDNSANTSAVMAKVVDLERRTNVRHLYVLAGERFTVERLAAGRYEVRYQNVQVGGSLEECVTRRKKARPDDSVVHAGS